VIAWIKNHLVPEVRDWWRLWSARFLIAAIALDALALAPVLGMLPHRVRNISPLLFDSIQLILVCAALIARFVRQPKLEARRAAAK
jgi:hypothetical protein